MIVSKDFSSRKFRDTCRQSVTITKRKPNISTIASAAYRALRLKLGRKKVFQILADDQLETSSYKIITFLRREHWDNIKLVLDMWDGGGTLKDIFQIVPWEGGFFSDGDWALRVDLAPLGVEGDVAHIPLKKTRRNKKPDLRAAIVAMRLNYRAPRRTQL